MRTPEYDAFLFDLDGVVYTGDEAVPGAPQALKRLRAEGRRVRFVTNNASRTPQQVADKLVGVGVQALAAEVLGSARAGAELLNDLPGVQADAEVAVVGGQGLLVAVSDQGFIARPVAEVVDRPTAIIQGFAPDLTWSDLAAASHWVRAGVPWVATNLDLTIPTGNGPAPGNGALVRMVSETAGRCPDAVAGKPQPHLFLAAARSCDASHPLVVGDRLDTDIAGGRAAGFVTAMVLTGVNGVMDALVAEASHRPDHILVDLADLWHDDSDSQANVLTRLLHEAWQSLDSLDSADGTAREHQIREWSARLSPTAR